MALIPSKPDKERLLNDKRARKRARKLANARRAVDDSAGPRRGFLDSYVRAIGRKPHKRTTQPAPFTCPTAFSIIDDPDPALRLIASMAEAACSAGVRQVRIDQTDCTQLDLCAEAVLGVLLDNALSTKGVVTAGRLPANEPMRSIASVAGLPGIMKGSTDEIPTVSNFRVRSGRKRGESAEEAPERDILTTALANYLNSLLERYDARLSTETGAWLTGLLGEVIANAEDHSRQRRWWIGAYLHQESHSPVGDCHLVIFNFGRTVAETMGELPQTSLLRKRIEERISQHSTRKLFAKTWTTENLWTLYALQEGASRHQIDAHALSDRGQGTADLISFFQDLSTHGDGGAPPKMCFVSGHTHILFDGRYTMQEQPVDGGDARRIIAFNAANDLGDRPDPSCVTNLKERFPGTLISMRFYLGKEHLQSLGGAI